VWAGPGADAEGACASRVEGAAGAAAVSLLMGRIVIRNTCAHSMEGKPSPAGRSSP
jgi:hypothetical protein